MWRPVRERRMRSARCASAPAWPTPPEGQSKSRCATGRATGASASAVKRSGVDCVERKKSLQTGAGVDAAGQTGGSRAEPGRPALRAASRDARRSSPPLLPPGEKPQKHRVQAFVGSNKLVVHVCLGTSGPYALQKGPELFQVALFDLTRVDLDLPLVLHRQKESRIVERKAQLRGIDNLKYREVVLARPEMKNPLQRFLSIVEQIRKYHHQRPAGDFLRQMIGGAEQIGRFPGGGGF